ncbi:BTAD domain-containing putative transcriptional regulator, partial [Streptomyces goshikiensis]|uniref:AfsR/SARP family transcriptional regulator n=1 Tax=Streptomyces goshikiensis TaxID=1942 RepID=UPI0036A90E7A
IPARGRRPAPTPGPPPAGAALALGPNQQRALLAVLLLRAGRPVPVPELCDALWGERPPARAVGTVRTYASRLRALFEPDRPARAPARILVFASGGYALRLSRPAVDIDDFERGLTDAARLRTAGAVRQAYRTRERALALWTGPPRAGLPGPHAEARRDRLTGLWLTAREAHFHDALELGLDRETPAVPALRAFAAEHPLREGAQELLMRALHRAGRTGEALAVYEATRETLALELGATPGPGLTALHHTLRSRSRSRPTPRPPAGACAERGAAGPFVGRDAESDLVLGVLAGAPGAVPVAVLTGMPGIGKTALAAHVAERARGLFPDGVLRAGLGAGAAAPLGRLVRALGASGAAVPEGTEARAALYRSLLAGRRVLLLLDGARDTAGLLPLLPGTPGCAALVTSASRGLVVPGARPVEVPELEDGAALVLVGAVAGAPRGRPKPPRRRAQPP